MVTVKTGLTLKVIVYRSDMKILPSTLQKDKREASFQKPPQKRILNAQKPTRCRF
jgi:hypothetical protein